MLHYKNVLIEVDVKMSLITVHSSMFPEICDQEYFGKYETFGYAHISGFDPSHCPCGCFPFHRSCVGQSKSALQVEHFQASDQ